MTVVSSSLDRTELTARRRAREGARVDPRHARSWQLVNALWASTFDVAQLGSADAVILDVEDAVDVSRKDEARRLVVEWLASGGRAWVRINDTTTDDWARDIDALTGVPGLQGVVLAKVEAGEQVTATYERLGVPVVALMESALGIESAIEVARAVGAFRLAFGGGDYRKDTGTANTALAMAYPRTRLVLASRIAGLAGPVDAPTVSAAAGTIRQHCTDAADLGMTGKLCLDGDQPAVVNEAMSPTPADVAWARGFIADFEAAGRVVRDGSDKPRLARAEAITRWAGIFGITTAR